VEAINVLKHSTVPEQVKPHISAAGLGPGLWWGWAALWSSFPCGPTPRTVPSPLLCSCHRSFNKIWKLRVYNPAIARSGKQADPQMFHKN